MENLKGFTYPTAAKCEEITIFYQKQPFETYNATMGSVDHVQFLFKCYNNSFLGCCECILTMAKAKFRFSIFGLSHRLYRGSKVTVGSEDELQKNFKGIFVQEESSGTRFDHGQFEIKTFPIYASP